jgi:DNA invertase Pin-like site-specific DNA recombinase
MSRQEFGGKRVAVYARYSSQLQREASIEDQVRRCTQHVTDHGGTVQADLVFTDSAVSGTSMHRPAFERMMNLVDAKPAKVDVIVTEDMSRISRDFADAAHIFQKLRYLEVPLVGVADGVDTSSQHAKLTFTIKSLVSDLYIDDLRDKTLRGLEGRALAGYSTGGLPLGYRSEPVRDGYDRVIGHRIIIDEEQARVVQRIFALYLEGRSLETIARLFNEEHVPPPRAKSRHRRKGWVASTVRAMLHNEAYIGNWSFNRRQWVKVPGLGKRRPRMKDPKAVIRREYQDRRIIDEATWNDAQRRLAAVRACYVRPGQKQRGRGESGRQNNYALSGLLRCGLCGAPMTIHAGTSARYYRCSDQKKRGTCSNKLSLREDVAKRSLMTALRDRYGRPSAIAFLRKKLAQHLGEAARTVNAEVEERRARLDRVEQRIGGLVRFLSEGGDSDSVRSALKDMEAQAKAERAAIEAIKQDVARPIQLPRPEEVTACMSVLEEVMESDPLAAREQLRRLFRGGELLVHPQPTGVYEAEGNIDLRAFLKLRFGLDASQTSKARAPLSRDSGLSDGPDHLWSSHCCAGSQLDFPTTKFKGLRPSGSRSRNRSWSAGARDRRPAPGIRPHLEAPSRREETDRVRALRSRHRHAVERSRRARRVPSVPSARAQPDRSARVRPWPAKISSRGMAFSPLALNSSNAMRKASASRRSSSSSDMGRGAGAGFGEALMGEPVYEV